MENGVTISCLIIYHVETKKKAAWKVRDLEVAKEGSQAMRAGGADLLTAINTYKCCTTIITAIPRNALAVHSSGVFPLPLYEHLLFSLLFSSIPIHIAYEQQKKNPKEGIYYQPQNQSFDSHPTYYQERRKRNMAAHT